MTKLRHVSAK